MGDAATSASPRLAGGRERAGRSAGDREHRGSRANTGASALRRARTRGNSRTK